MEEANETSINGGDNIPVNVMEGSTNFEIGVLEEEPVIDPTTTTLAQARKETAETSMSSSIMGNESTSTQDRLRTMSSDRFSENCVGHDPNHYYERRLSTCHELDPPPSCGENFRDALLRFLDRIEFQYLGILVLVLVVADGALFFFLLMGWHGLCDSPSRTDCEPRNTWYNASVQILNVLFSYMALQTMPWRCTQFLHMTGWGCPYRANGIGKDLYGLPTNECWYHIPKCKRIGICLLLLWNCISQFINQGTRIYYNTYAKQESPPGSIWVNVFFVMSFAAAGLAGGWQAWEENKLRKANPNQFNDGPITMMKKHLQKYKQTYRQWCGCCLCMVQCFCCCGWLVKTSSDDDDDDEEAQQEQDDEQERVTDANTRWNEGHFSLLPQLPFDRTDLRLWGM